MDETTFKKTKTIDKPYRVIIEASALIDYMTFLRGITKDGGHFEDRTSLEFPRFPSFDGSDWDLPVRFEEFFDDAVKHRRLFDRVRPYDFALRELMFLTQNGADIKVFVPPELVSYHSRINEWTANFLPGLRTVAGNINDINTHADVWVARSPNLAHWLIDAKQPFVLIDGKENRQLDDVIRSIRWDQAGYFLRQSHSIHEQRIHHPDKLLEAKIPRFDFNGAHQDINNGLDIFPPNVAEATIWVGEQIRLSHVFLSEDFKFDYEDGTQMSPDQIERAKTAIKADLEDLRHKQKVLRKYLELGFELRTSNPTWARYIAAAELQMQTQLREIEKITRMNPITGELPRNRKAKNYQSMDPQFTQAIIEKTPGTSPESYNSDTRILISLQDLNIPKRFQAIEIIESISELVSTGAQLRGKAASKSNITGALAEDIATSFLHRNGWKILMPRHRVNAPQSGKRNGDINVEWIDSHGNVERGAVDIIAKDPNGQLHIIEIKAKKSSELSPQQKKLKKHLENGGTILNPDCSSLRKDQKSFKASYTVIAFEQARVTKRRRLAKHKSKQKPPRVL